MCATISYYDTIEFELRCIYDLSKLWSLNDGILKSVLSIKIDAMIAASDRVQ
jgi:hypothetical protein